MTETGIEVKVISGDEEAQLIYRGVASAVPLGNIIGRNTSGSCEISSCIEIRATESQRLDATISSGAQRGPCAAVPPGYIVDSHAACSDEATAHVYIAVATYSHRKDKL